MVLSLKRFCFFLVLFSKLSFSQNFKNIDSLLSVYEKEHLSKERQAQELRLIAVKHSDLNQALQFVQLSLAYALELNDPLLVARIWESTSSIQRELGNNSLSFEASLKGLKVYESLGLLENQAASYNQIAGNYLIDEDYQKAIIYYKKAREIYRNSEQKINLYSTLLNLGEAYRLFGDLNKAKANFQEVLKSKIASEHPILKGYALGNLGMVYATKSKFKFAKEHFNEAIPILKESQDWYSASVYIAELGAVFQKEGKFALAERQYLEAFSLAEANGLKEQVRDISRMLTSLYEEKRSHAEALKFQKIYQKYQDSLVNKTNIQKLEQLKSGYEIEKRESEIGILHIENSNQKRWVIALTIGVLLFVFLAYLLFRGNKKIRQTNKELFNQKEIISHKEQEKALLLRELNHRVKNNLQMISSLLSLQSSKLSGHPAQEAIITGKNRVEALSLVHRKLYQEGVDTRIHVDEYIKELVLGLFHGYQANFEPEFYIAEVSVGIDNAIPLALIVNELILNALKYAYSGIENPSLLVRIKPRAAGRLEIDIRDNGIGFEADAEGKSNSLGLKIINSLILQLDGTIEKINEKGTHWKLNVKAT